MASVRISTMPKECVLSAEQASLLVTELAELDPSAYPDAAAVQEELATRADGSITSTYRPSPIHRAALSRVLDGLSVERPLPPGGLQRLFDGVRIEEGSITQRLHLSR